ncbi:MAG: NAD-dependent epimerase/dehydratase family protein [Clostridia bacterium]|nr:NAD-dependent epimerase/dehydratase family protein [Clostridia bacterium]
MNDTCIVTGGAGFIGCALSQGLTERFDRVIAVDILNPQIHPEPKRPDTLAKNVEFIHADICDGSFWDQLLAGVQGFFSVIHLAAETGTAQSLDHATLHTHTNVVGTSMMLDAFVRNRKLPKEILLTSSRAVYGEGKWQSEDGTVFYPGQRSDVQLRNGQWDFPNACVLPQDAENTMPAPTSVYGVTKLCQEHLLSVWGKAMNVGIKIVRLQNVYGAGQSLINPYTGIVSLFVRLAKAGQVIPLYEDGNIIRDFVLIDDVKQAILMALDSDACFSQVLDIGTGVATTISQIACWIAKKYGASTPQVCGKYRNGDVRHAFCNSQRTEQILGFHAVYSVEQGLERLCQWIDEQMGK